MSRDWRLLKTSGLGFGVILLGAMLSGPVLLALPGNQPALAQPATKAPAPPHITFKGGPGDTPETAVLISGAPNSIAGIAAEYAYLRKKFGRENVDWNLYRQSVLEQDGKFYDRLELDLKDGSRKTVFFDISEFFGKL
jgi:hypothetical protein